MLPFLRPNIAQLHAKRDVDRLIKALVYKPKSDALDDVQVRVAAATALGSIGDTRAVEPLVQAVRKGMIREAAANALGKIKDVRAVEPLAAVLTDLVFDAWNIQRSAVNWTFSHGIFLRARPLIEALRDIGDVRAVETLRTMLQSRNTAVVAAAAQALGALRDSRAVSALIAVIRKDDSLVDSVDQALAAIGWEPRQDEASAVYWIANRQYERCEDIGTPAVGPLMEVLVNPLPARHDLGWKAAQTLIRMKNPASVEPLIDALHLATPWGMGGVDAYVDVRCRAVAVLSALRDPRAVAPLAWGLQDRYEQVREAAGDALDQFPVEMLIQALSGPPTDDIHARGNQEAVAKALEYLGWQPDSAQTEPPVGWRRVRLRRQKQE